MNNRYHGFGQIAKVEPQDDGTIKVYGIASTGEKDAAGEVVLPDAMKAALPDYSKFPALREMHQPSAAGRVLEAEVDEDGVTNIVAHVVDPVAITKVKTGVYGGFSIGGKVLERDKTDRTVIKSLRLTEISLVDVPCNPGATLNMWKADMTTNIVSSEDVVAKAKELAKAQGTNRYKDFVYEARQMLQKAADEAAAAAAEAEDGDGEGEGAGEGEPTSEGEAGAEAAAGSEGDAGTDGAGEGAGEGDGSGEGSGDADGGAAKSDDATAITDPLAAVTDALNKAKGAAAEPLVDAAPAEDKLAKALDAHGLDMPSTAQSDLFADLPKAGRAIVLLAKAATSDDDVVAKSLYTVERTARVLESLGCIAQSVVWEENAEGDTGSVLPQQAVDLVDRIRTFLVSMVNEEVAELMTQLANSAPNLILADIMAADEDYDADDVMLANQIVDVAKADTALMEKVGARNSKSDMAKMQAIHDNIVALGASCGSDQADKVAGLEAENDRLTKGLAEVPGQIDEITKAFTDTIGGLKNEIADLSKRLEEVANVPAAPKTATNLTPISKGQDASGIRHSEAAGSGLSPDEFRKAFDRLPEEEKGMILLKVALNNPQLVKQSGRAPTA